MYVYNTLENAHIYFSQVSFPERASSDDKKGHQLLDKVWMSSCVLRHLNCFDSLTTQPKDICDTVNCALA